MVLQPTTHPGPSHAEQSDQRASHGLVGQSPQIASVRRLIAKASRTPFSVILLGESGTGKEVVAHAIHNSSQRADRPFVVIDCGSLAGNLMESELFGHVRGAFSGAYADKQGLVEAADGGTAFFDEIGDLALDLQVKLLRLIQEREFRPVGALHPRKVDLRIIAATNRDLEAEVAAGRFRLDLFHRLNVFPIHLPPLRERREDIPLLLNHFLCSLEIIGLPPFHPGEAIIDLLLSHSWPGNIRELKHCIERMVALQSDGVVHFEDMPAALLKPQNSSGHHPPSRDTLSAEAFRVRPKSVMSIPDSEKQVILAALAATRGNRAQAAEILRISRTTLYRRIKEYGVVFGDTQ